MAHIPTIDPNVTYGTAATLKQIAADIRQSGTFNGACVVHDGRGNRVAVLLSYEAYMAMQNTLDALGESVGEGMGDWRDKVTQ